MKIKLREGGLIVTNLTILFFYLLALFSIVIFFPSNLCTSNL